MNLSGSMPLSCLLSESHCPRAQAVLAQANWGARRARRPGERTPREAAQRALGASRPVALGEADLAPTAAHPTGQPT